MRLKVESGVIAAILLLGPGCAGTRPVHYYTIDLPPASNQTKADGPAMVVGNIVTPESLQDGRIRYRSGTNEAGAYEYHRWTERPGTMVREVLVRALRASGKYRRVVEATSAASGDYLLRGKLHEFDEVDRGGIETRISMHVELVDMKTNRSVWDRSVERTEPVAGKTVTDVVQSMDRNLRQVIGEVTGGIEEFLSARR